MKIKLLGAAKTVTGSCYSLVTKNEKILIDCGMFQGSKEMERMNYEDFSFNPKDYSALILTHAHLDHSGRIPKLIKYGFRGKIYCTEETKALAEIIMMDSAHIAKQDTEEENERRAKQGLPPRKPIYNEIDVQNALKLFRIIEYGQDVKISKDILARFYDAGHILGAASIQLRIKEGKRISLIAFSGDLGQANAVLVKNTTPIPKADYAFIESTYGDRLHPAIEVRKNELLRIINETYKRGGKLMIPSFAVERAQEILYYIGEFMREGLIPRMNVYLDSPMAMKATKVFTEFTKDYNETIQESIGKKQDLFEFPELIYTETTDESKKINGITEPCIVIAGNGMCTAGRIKHHIRNNIENPKNTLLFIGYQAEGTLGYWMKKGQKKIKLLGVQIPVKSKIESIDGFSAHADYLGLTKWAESFSTKPKKLFVTHGEESQSQALAKRLEKIGFKTYVPNMNEELEL